MTPIHRYLLPLLILAAPALAADVEVELDTGSGFVVQNNGASVERLRVDEATGNISRNGALFVHTTGTNSTFVGPYAGNTYTQMPLPRSIHTIPKTGHSRRSIHS